MEDFKPSDNFVHRTMEDIRAFEKERSKERERLRAFLLLKQVRFALYAGGILLGVLNLIRMASVLISPALCL
jgi:hypothetical protein